MFAFIKFALQRPLDTEPLLKSLPFSTEQGIEIWGPVTSYKYDARSTQIVNRFVSMLVHRIEETDTWFIVQQVNTIQNGEEWSSRPTASEITENVAGNWLRENHSESPWRIPGKPR